MTRRSFLSASAAGATQAHRAAAERPNVLFIITDQQSNRALPANGNPYLQTPVMDAIAADGITFTESYCTYPVCSPARSSFFTGRMPHETGVRNNGQRIAPGIPTMGAHFRESGYHPLYAGKWHLPGSFSGVTGFDELHGGHRLGSQMDEGVAKACVDFITGKPRQPFLMVASFMNPHDVCDWIRAHPGSRDFKSTAGFPPPPLNMAVDPDEPEYMQYHRVNGYDLMSQAVKIASEWKSDDVRYYLHGYYRLVEAVDRQIGRLIDALHSSGMYERTVILLTTDHGEGMGAHRWVQKGAFWEETAKVPFLVAGAGLARRGIKDTRSLVSGIDVLPTLCDYAGIPSPAGVRGRSVRAAIEGAGFDRQFVVSELSEFGQKERQGRMLRTQRYKYVVFNGGRRPEQLFDLDLDPGEVQNLARSATEKPVLDQHRKLLAGWIAETRDDFQFPKDA